MCKVYSYSVLNIAAMSAMDSSEGLFSRRDCALFDHPSITLPSDLADKTSEPLQFAIAQDSRERTFFDIEVSPLNRRAWFQQERWISRRTLFFTETQLYWACRDKFASEEWPLGL